MSEPANSDDLYVVLGVEPSASQVEIRRAYLQQSRLTHPDKEGGSTEAFLALKFAFTILSDPLRRCTYNQKRGGGGKAGGGHASAAPEVKTGDVVFNAFAFAAQ